MLSSNTKYASLSPAVHEVVDAICERHNSLRKRDKYLFLTSPSNESGLGRVGQREYLANLKCAVANSVNAIPFTPHFSANASAEARRQIDDATVGLDYLFLLNRLALLDSDERVIVDEEGVLPFNLSR